MRALLIALSLAAAVAGLAPIAAAGGVIPIDTFDPGPYGVGSFDWDFGTVAVDNPTGGGTINVDHFGTLRYPAFFDGVLAPPAPGPFPFIVFAHGRFHAAPFIGTNHTQASYLLDHLASWGFVVASVNLDVVGQFGFPAAIPQRGELIHHTIDAFEALDPNQIVLSFDRIGLIGHSRGGEGAVSAFDVNPQGHNIVAVGTISPTDFEAIHMSGAPHLGIYGSKDGDVNNGWPIYVYDNATGAPKAFEYVEGANHFWFTDSIHFTGEGSADITREEHHDIARTYFTKFMQTQLGSTVLPFDELADGPSLFPLTDTIEIHPMFDDDGALVVNHFEDTPLNAGLNSLGGSSISNLLNVQTEESLDNTGKTFYQQTKGGWVEFLGGGPSTWYAEQLPGGANVTGFSHLSLRALQRYNAPLNVANVDQDMTLALVDLANQVALVPLSDHGTVPWPKVHSGFSFPNKSVLRTTRVPLSAFQDDNPAINLTNVQFVGLIFNTNPRGELRIDDIAFTD